MGIDFCCKYLWILYFWIVLSVVQCFVHCTTCDSIIWFYLEICLLLESKSVLNRRLCCCIDFLKHLSSLNFLFSRISSFWRSGSNSTLSKVLKYLCQPKTYVFVNTPIQSFNFPDLSVFSRSQSSKQPIRFIKISLTSQFCPW